MDLLIGLVSASVAIYAFVAAYFAIVWFQRRQDNHYGIFAILCVALSEHSIARIASYRAVSAESALASARLGLVGLIAAFALIIHFAFRYVRLEDAKRWLLLVYVTAGAYEVLNARGLLHDAKRLGEWTLPLGTYRFVYRGAPMNALGHSLYALCAVAVTVVLIVTARSYLSGRREALPVVMGTTMLLATVINDVGFASNVFATAYLVEMGFVAFALGVTSTLGVRYANVSNELDRRRHELRTRTRELRKSYEELRAAQEELVKKEQLAVVGELAAVIAHEVRNPLAIIGNAVAGLRKASLSREDHDTLLVILDEETSRLNRLVSDLLRYARPVNLQRQQIALTDLLDRGLHLARDKKGLKIELKVEVATLRLWGDPNLLRQVFDNLIDNAVQAMSYGGHLTVRIRPMTDEGGSPGLAVDISDTGEGMDTQVRSRAKDPFFTTRPSGTGLGLAIVDRIVDAHGGRFIIDSHAGEGTTVTVFLPYGSQSEPPPKSKLPPTPVRPSDRPSGDEADTGGSGTDAPPPLLDSPGGEGHALVSLPPPPPLPKPVPRTR